MAKNSAASVKDRPLYKALRDEGLGKKKAARVVNAVGDNKNATGRRQRNGRHTDYEDRTKTELLERARQRNIRGRSSMSKKQLITALRKG